MADEAYLDKKILKANIKYDKALSIQNRKEQEAYKYQQAPYRPTVIKLLKTAQWVLQLNKRLQMTIVDRLNLPAHLQSSSWWRRKMLEHTLNVQLKNLQKKAISSREMIQKYEYMKNEQHSKYKHFGGWTRKRVHKTSKRRKKTRRY
jgi:hypothetical protein